MPIYLIVILLLVVAAILYIAVCFVLSGSFIHLNRQPVPKNPKDYGMDFEDIAFKAVDGVTLRGWLIPGSSKKLVIMTHVGGLTKYGSTVNYRNLAKLYNEEIEFLKTAIHLHENGYWVLTFDFRNHGESDPSPNRGIAGVGLYEYQDIIAAMHFIENRENIGDMDIGFVSFCTGANSTIIAMSKKPEVFERVKCLIAIQPISMEVFTRTYAKKIFTPVIARLLLPMIKKFVVWRGADPLEKMSPKDYVKDIKVPTLYVQARNDPWTELSDIQGFYEDTAEPKEFYWIEGTKHRFDTYKYFQDKPEKILAWLKEWL